MNERLRKKNDKGTKENGRKSAKSPTERKRREREKTETEGERERETAECIKHVIRFLKASLPK